MALQTEDLETYWKEITAVPTFPCTPDIHIALDRLLDALNHFCWLTLNLDSKADEMEDLPNDKAPYFWIKKERKDKKLHAFLIAPSLENCKFGAESLNYAEVVRTLFDKTVEYLEKERQEQLVNVQRAEDDLAYERAKFNFVKQLLLQVGEFRPEQPNLPLPEAERSADTLDI